MMDNENEHSFIHITVQMGREHLKPGDREASVISISNKLKLEKRVFTEDLAHIIVGVDKSPSLHAGDWKSWQNFSLNLKSGNQENCSCKFQSKVRKHCVLL